MKKILALSLACVMAVGLLAGCGGNGDSGSTNESAGGESGTLTVSLASSPSKLDPIHYSGSYEGQIINQVCDRLVDMGATAVLSETTEFIGAEHILARRGRTPEIRQRIYALFAVFGVVIFFWVSFHQNGYSLTYFARDYVNLDVININLGFTTIKGAEIFQSVNPFFVVTLTPLIMWFFGWLRKRSIEVSTPMKIAIGMGIAATAYLFLMFFSFALPDKAALAGMKADQVQSILVTPWVMVGLYFILTVAELFISPLGLAFVSKVAPPHMQGLMQGFWLAATAVGNALLFVGGWLYMHTPMWATWCVFVAACGMSMLVMLSMVRWLERVTK